MQELHLGDYGIALQFEIVKPDDTVHDLSTATTMTLRVTKPSGTNTTKTLTLVNDGTDGLCKYTLVDGDLDEIGLWLFQPVITYASSEFSVDPVTIQVLANLGS